MIQSPLSFLNGKTILIVSPQAWGTMFLSKHHYAVELARAGNRVFFLNPPVDSLSDQVVITPSKEYEGLFIIQHKLFFPYNLKFHAIPVFHFLMRWQIRKILNAISVPLDIVWSFDIGNLYPLNFFPTKALKIFHPVDEPLNKVAFDSGRGAQVIFSVTKEILQKYHDVPASKVFINHGVNELFLDPQSFQRQSEGQKIKVGLSGNLLRIDIDRPVLLKIIHDNPLVDFHCWGSYRKAEANIAGGTEDPDTFSFIEELKKLDNVILHGAVNYTLLASSFPEMDAFLICYDVQKDQSKGTNYHKIMEYLASGKVIISNNVTTYQGKPELIQMVEERDHNQSLPGLFQIIIRDLNVFNSMELRKIRIEYAANNTYSMQIRQIDQKLLTLGNPKSR